jgi:hypothetical protein
MMSLRITCTIARSLPRSAWIAMAATLGLLALAGCSNQSEGERCSRLAGSNGSDDCEPGLSCQSITASWGTLDLCCPPPGGRAPTVSECIPGQKIQTDAGAESSTADSGEPDAAAEAQGEASGGDETSMDALAEVADDVSSDAVTE